MVEIYQKDASELNQQDLADFNAIIANAHFNHPAAIRIIGDELADRGNNDYFTLKLLNQLNNEGIKTEILMSNHSAEFLDCYAKKSLKKPAENILGKSNTKSLHGLSDLMARGLVSEAEIEDIVENDYKPNLKAISYSVDNSLEPPKLTLYTHAPVGLETVKSMAKLLEVDYNDESIEALCKTIDSINEQLYSLINRESIHTKHSDFLTEWSMGLGQIAIPHQHPLLRLMWNRGDADIDKQKQNIDNYGIVLPQSHNGFQLALIHGHDGPIASFLGKKEVSPVESYLPNMFNTDNDLGKRSLTGDYHAISSTDMPSNTPTPLLINSDNQTIQPDTVPFKIKRIFQSAEKVVSRAIDKKLPKNEEQWHQAFIEHQIASFAQQEKANPMQQVNREYYKRSLARKILHLYRVDVTPEEQKKFSQQEIGNDDLVKLSIKAVQNQNGYQREFNSFKEQAALELRIEFGQTKEGQELAKKSIQNIQKILEQTQWKLGSCGSNSSIMINGNKTPVPATVAKMHKICLKAESSQDTVELLKQIRELSAKSSQTQSVTIFKRFRQRHRTTLEYYKAIHEETAKILNPTQKL